MCFVCAAKKVILTPIENKFLLIKMCVRDFTLRSDCRHYGWTLLLFWKVGDGFVPHERYRFIYATQWWVISISQKCQIRANLRNACFRISWIIWCYDIDMIPLCNNSLCFNTKQKTDTPHKRYNIQGGPKITERHTSGNKDIRWLVSVDGVSSPEKNDTKISHFG